MLLTDHYYNNFYDVTKCDHLITLATGNDIIAPTE